MDVHCVVIASKQKREMLLINVPVLQQQMLPLHQPTTFKKPHAHVTGLIALHARTCARTSSMLLLYCVAFQHLPSHTLLAC
jgi:hypothetical protein